MFCAWRTCGRGLVSPPFRTWGQHRQFGAPRLISNTSKVLNRPSAFSPAPIAAEPGAMAMPLPGQRPLWRDLLESKLFWGCVALGATVYFPSRYCYDNDVYFKEEVDFWWHKGHELVLNVATDMYLDIREWYMGDEGSYYALDQFWSEHRARENLFQLGEERTLLLLSEDAVDYTADLPYVWRGVIHVDEATRKLRSYILGLAPEDKVESRKAAQLLLDQHAPQPARRS